MRETLNVAIMAQFLDQIIKGAKDTEYRAMSDYWMRKLVDVGKYGEGLDEAELRDAITKDKEVAFRPYKKIRFHCGERKLEKEIKGIRVYPSHGWFAIKLGRTLPLPTGTGRPR